MDTQKTARLTSKDLITLGIFTAIFMICLMATVGVMGMTPITYIFGVSLAGIPCGIVYMLMRVKVPKFGGILITAAIPALILLLMGGMWTLPVGMMVGGLLAELISFSKKYKSFWANTLGFMVLMTCFNIGSYGPCLFMRDFYVASATGQGIDPTYLNKLLDLFTGPVFAGVVAAGAVGALLGSLIAKKLLKKHFVKAGIA